MLEFYPNQTCVHVFDMAPFRGDSTVQVLEFAQLLAFELSLVVLVEGAERVLTAERFWFEIDLFEVVATRIAPRGLEACTLNQSSSSSDMVATMR